MQLHGKRALVMGLGIHGGGLGVARFLAAQGADVTVTDLRSPETLEQSLVALQGLPIRYVLGEHREADFANAELVVRNPAVPRESRFLQIARAAGAQVEMEMTLFFRLCPGQILGITGTKGKTTTTLLTGAMLRAQYPETVIAGNLRVSALEALPRITADTPVVLELSSFVLEGLGEAGLSPPYAAITNISADHLDRYATLASYAETKRQIIAHQSANGVAVLNRDDPLSASWAATAPGSVVWVGSGSSGLPDSGYDAICYDQSGLWWSSRGTRQTHICTLDDIPLAGQHNVANVATAAALAKSYGVVDQAIVQAIRSFAGVEHRLEVVRELDGVRYINDTAATAPKAAIAALNSFDAPIVLIAGGADKNLPFADLARAIADHAKAVVLLAGSATERLSAELRMQNVELRNAQSAGQDSPLQFSILNSQFSIQGPFDDFERAIRAARELAAPGDIVLLSPGCASFGMFRNEFHRGEEFRRIVNGL